MSVIVNGKELPLPVSQNLLDLINTLNLNPNEVVAELNHDIVPGTAFATTVLHSGDKLELLHFVGGG